MKAIVLTGYGAPEDTLELQDVPRPEPKDDEVRLRVRATAVNDWDWGYVRGDPLAYRLLFGLFSPNQRILGAEVAGEVEAVGASATRFAVGDAVYGDISEAGFGGFAEYVCVREGALALKPADMSFEEATTIPHAGMLALQGLVDLGEIRAGQTVLINGAGGGVGTFGVQIAKRHGCEVTGVDSGAKLESMRSLGFDHVVDYRKDDFTRSGRRYDLILDAKTTRSPFRHVRALAANGTYVTVGGSLLRLLQTLLLAPLFRWFAKKRFRIVALKTNKDLGYLNQMFEDGGLRFAIDGPYELAQLPQAMQRFGDAEHLGKVVVSVG